MVELETALEGEKFEDVRQLVEANVREAHEPLIQAEIAERMDAVKAALTRKISVRGLSERAARKPRKVRSDKGRPRAVKATTDTQGGDAGTNREPHSKDGKLQLCTACGRYVSRYANTCPHADCPSHGDANTKGDDTGAATPESPKATAPGDGQAAGDGAITPKAASPEGAGSSSDPRSRPVVLGQSEQLLRR